jgi:lipopolysaccharide export system permease protein
MKILDRYVLFTFLRNYLISFMVLIGLFIVLDMVFNFDELVDIRIPEEAGPIGAALHVGKALFNYYFYQIFLIFTHLSGVIPVVAAAFTLVRMSRSNETVAMLAAGVPLVRIAAPIIIVAVIINFVLLPVNQELLIPNMIPQLIRHRDDVLKDKLDSFPIRALFDGNNVLMAARYYPVGVDRRPAMREVDIIERDEQLRPVAHTRAAAAHWNGRTWELVEGYRVTGLLASQRRSPETALANYTGTVTPDEITLYRNSEFVNLLSTERINQLLQRPNGYGTVDLLRVKHFRWSQLILNTILLLLAIPCVLTREPGTLKRAAGKTLVFTGICLGASFISYQIAGQPPSSSKWIDRWPALWAWMPIFVFAPIAVVLLDRLYTKRT